MDDQRFDRVTRLLAGAGSRRGFLRALAAVVVGSAVTAAPVAASQMNPNRADKSGPDSSEGCAAVCKNESATKESRIKCGCTGVTTTTTTTAAPTTTTTTTTAAPSCLTGDPFAAVACNTDADCAKFSGSVCNGYWDVCICPLGKAWNSTGTACEDTGQGTNTGAGVCTATKPCDATSSVCGTYGTFSSLAFCSVSTEGSPVCAKMPDTEGTCTASAQCNAGRVCAEDMYAELRCIPTI